MPEKRRPVALLVRHGSTVLNKNKAFRSRLDPSLDKTGFAQAEEVAAYVKDRFDVYKIVTSPLLRACQTADAIADEVDVDVEQERSLFPWHLGFLGGKDKKTYEPILEFFIDNPTLDIPDGESLDTFEDRVQDFFEIELKIPEKSGIPLYVTHTSVIITLGNLLDESANGRPEVGESSVEPGGLMVVYSTEDGFEMKPAFGEEERNAEFGS
jgi:broad specificity phosphatase PhoE